jgi:SAM-dependent methyltransferase
VTSPASPVLFDRALLARRRDRHAAEIRTRDFLLRRAAEDITDRLSLVKRHFPLAVDLGGGAGVLTEAVLALPTVDRVVTTDLSPALAERLTPAGIVADEEALPFAAGSLDLVVSALALQLVNDLPGALLQIRRALKPDGLLIAALLGGATLHELREALYVAESETTGGASPRVAPFADVRDLGALLQRAGFALPVADSDTVEVGYGFALELMQELRAMGWSNVLLERRRRFLPRATLVRAAEVYAERHGRADGRIRATFEIVTLTGWAPHESQQKPLRPGSASARLADALGVPERKAGDRDDGGSG